MRKIIVEGKEYGWKMGKENIVVRDPETNKSCFIPAHKVAGMNPEDWCPEYSPITPKMVAGSIREYKRLNP